MNDVRFPEIVVELTGTDGNAFAIMGAVTRQFKSHPEAKNMVKDFMDEAMSGDYDHLLQTCMRWVTVV